MYPGQHMSIEDNIFYAKRNIVDSIWKEANIEGIDITFPATKAVFEGAKIANLTQDQTTVINNLKHGWQFIFDFIDAPIDLSYVRQVHQLVSNNLVPDSGQLRYFDVYIGGTSWQPEIPDFDTAKAAIEKIANMEPGRERALKLTSFIEKELLHIDLLNSFIPQMQNTALVFQGETALRLCYGAPRYSEDYARRQKLFLTNEQIGK